jgi:hypothetical protein
MLRSELTMQAVKTNRPIIHPKSKRIFILTALIAGILILAAIYSSAGLRAFQAARLPRGTLVISQRVLEEQYGLRVNLLGVTAAGGFVDLRLKIVDGEKLKRLLPDEKAFPVLRTEQGVILNTSEETKAQKIEYVSGGGLYILYPNARNAVKPNTPVTILFGNIALESVFAK